MHYQAPLLETAYHKVRLHINLDRTFDNDLLSVQEMLDEWTSETKRELRLRGRGTGAPEATLVMNRNGSAHVELSLDAKTLLDLLGAELVQKLSR